MYLVTISGSKDQATLIYKIKKYIEGNCKFLYVYVPNFVHYSDEVDERVMSKLSTIYCEAINNSDLCIFIPKFKPDLFDKYNKITIEETGPKGRNCYGKHTSIELEYAISKNKDIIIYSFDGLEDKDQANNIITRQFVMDLYHFLNSNFDSKIAEEYFKNIIS